MDSLPSNWPFDDCPLNDLPVPTDAAAVTAAAEPLVVSDSMCAVAGFKISEGKGDLSTVVSVMNGLMTTLQSSDGIEKVVLVVLTTFELPVFR